jgi:Winged helix-turn-helix domain (DUF2582)
MKETIGEMAGSVWNILNEKGSQTVAKLKTALKADAFVLDAAIGWLAREGKIEISKAKASITIKLK